MTKNRITPAHLTAMYHVRTGANVFSRGIAQLLREIEHHDPELIDIMAPQEMIDDMGMSSDELTDENGRLCYFGAVLTAKGKAFLQRATADMTRGKYSDLNEKDEGDARKEIIQSAMQDDLPSDPALKIPSRINKS